MIKRKPLVYLAIVLLTFGIVGCEDDFSELDTAIKGNKSFNAKSKTFPVVSYTKPLAPVQTNRLTSNLLGIYNDPNFGTTTANLITQVVPQSYNPDFGEDPKIVSIILNIPYFSTLIGKVGDENKYELDSIYGNLVNTFKLSIYESKYLLRDLDPSTGYKEAQAYYANEMSKIDAELGELLFSRVAFTPLDKDYPDDTDEDGKKRIVPSMRFDLKKDGDTFWENLLFANQGKPALSNADNFKNHFRGLVFKPELTGTKGNAFLLNFLNSAASITINYTNKENTDPLKPLKYILKFTGQRFNTFENTFVIPEGDTNNGDDILSIKGMQGSMAVLDLFNGSIKNDNNIDVNALDYFNSKKDDWLINEATLTLYVDNNTVSAPEPNRLLLYDLKNNIPIMDYFLDAGVNDASLSKLTHSVPLKKDEDGNGIKYKIRITKHISNLLKEDSTNVKLGVYVTNNINLAVNSKIYGIPQDDNDNTINKVPVSSVLYPLGTRIYGSKTTVPENKRLEFKIYYTEPNLN